jgi:hypothetical protein
MVLVGIASMTVDGCVISEISSLFYISTVRTVYKNFSAVFFAELNITVRVLRMVHLVFDLVHSYFLPKLLLLVQRIIFS